MRRLALAGAVIGAGLFAAGLAVREPPMTDLGPAPAAVHELAGGSASAAILTEGQVMEGQVMSVIPSSLEGSAQENAEETAPAKPLMLILYGPPYRSHGKPVYATPDTGLLIEVALALNEGYNPVVFALNNPTPEDAALNNRFEEYLDRRIPELDAYLGDAAAWMETHPERVFTGLTKEDALSSIAALARQDLIISMTVHGNSEYFVPALGADGSYRGVPHENLGTILADAAAEGESIEVRLNQCGGREIAKHLLDSFYSRAPGSADLTVLITSDNAAEPWHRLNLIDYHLASLAMAEHGGSWEQYNAADSVTLFGSEVPLYQGNIPGHLDLDLEVARYGLRDGVLLLTGD